MSQRPAHPRHASLHLGLIVGGVLCVGMTLFVLAVGVVGLYTLSSDALPLRVLARVLPFPAASVNGDWIRYAVWSKYTRTFVGLAETGKESIPDALTRHDIAQHVLDRLIRNQVLERIAEEKGISVTATEVDAAYARIVASKEDAQVFADELRLLDWSARDVKTHLIRPYVLGRRLSERLGSVAAADALVAERLAAAKVRVYVRL